MSQRVRLTEQDITLLNERLEDHTPEAIIQWTVRLFGPRVAVLTAMQKAGCVVCEMIARLGLQKQVDVLFVDTEVNFRETYETIEKLREQYGLNIISLKPDRTMEEQIRDEGVLYLTKDGQKRCCQLRKHEPLKQIIGKYDALIGSLRRAEGGKRGKVPVLAIDMELNLLRVHPIFKMTTDEMEARIEERKIIVNPLHAQGYPTIGCDRCTTPVLPGEEERAGRWRHLENAAVYCAINPTDRDKHPGAADEFIELNEDTAKRVMDFSI